MALSKSTLADIARSGDLDRMHNALVSYITDTDARDEKRALRSGRRHNIYALGHMLGAAQRAYERTVAEGAADTKRSWVLNVCDCFNPTKGMHTFLKNFMPALDVKYGRWTLASRG